jgi:hypothetical protein
MDNHFDFSASQEWKSMNNKTSSQGKTVIQTSAECECYELSMNIFDYPPLLSNFTSLVVNSYLRNKWSDLIDIYGTHFVYEVTMGGRVTYEATLSAKGVSQISSSGVDFTVAAEAKFGKMYADSSYSNSKNNEQIRYLDDNTESNRTMILGGSAPENGNVTFWMDSVIQSPMPLKYKLY